MPVRIIAEIGSNYNGDLQTAKDYIKAVKDCGGDIVKFQTFKKETLVAPKIKQDGEWVDNPVFSNFANLELPDEWHAQLKKEADHCGIEFMSAPFYVEAVDLLEEVGVSTYKIASGDITFLPLLKRVAQTGKSVILSTGASTLEEVRTALDCIKNSGGGEVTLLHCVVSYPPQWDEMNLNTITTLKNEFKLPVGISDHSPGTTVPIASVALGATAIEKHVTFDRNQSGPDHPFAMTMDEFADMIQQVKNLEQALGTGIKEPTPSESARQHRFRRGCYSLTDKMPTENMDEAIWLRPMNELNMKEVAKQ